MIMANAASRDRADLFALTLMENRLLLQRFTGLSFFIVWKLSSRWPHVTSALFFSQSSRTPSLQEARILVAVCRRAAEANAPKAIQQSRRSFRVSGYFAGGASPIVFSEALAFALVNVSFVRNKPWSYCNHRPCRQNPRPTGLRAWITRPNSSPLPNSGHRFGFYAQVMVSPTKNEIGPLLLGRRRQGWRR